MDALITQPLLLDAEPGAESDRDDFLLIVTHEIKTPLTSITGYTQFAEDAVKNNEPQAALESLEIVRTEVRRILQLAEDLLDSSRLSAGRFTVNMEGVDLVAIVSQIANRYARTTERKVELHVPREFPMVVCDSLRLAQVVENLVSNAAKYSPDGTPIEISLQANDAGIQLSVSDHGAGIPAEKIPLIFERFYRLKEYGTPVKGTGLGLFICKELVRMHGGSIRVDSKKGEGTTFTIDLPRQC